MDNTFAVYYSRPYDNLTIKYDLFANCAVCYTEILMLNPAWIVIPHMNDVGNKTCCSTLCADFYILSQI